MNDAASKPALDYPWTEPPPAGTTVELLPGLHWVRMRLPFPPDHINLWLVEDGPGWTVIDTGYTNDDIKEAWEQVFAATLGGKPITRVLVTHFHPDHLGLAHWLVDRWRAPLWMTATEWLTARAVLGAITPEDAEDRLAFYASHGVGAEHFGPYREPNLLYRRGVPSVPTSFRRIEAGTAVRIGHHDWWPIIGRGHAPEHACLHCPSLSVLIGGDILLPRISPNVSVWPAEPFANPLRHYIDCLSGFADVPADTLILPAHGLPYRGVHARIADLDVHHRERLDVVAEACAAPASATELMPRLFRREIGPGQIALAIGEVLAHVHCLEADGRVGRSQDSAGLWRFQRTGGAG